MTRKTVRFEPYAPIDPEDVRLPDFVAGCAAMLDPDFVLDEREVNRKDTSNRKVRKWETRVGKDKGVSVGYHATMDSLGNPSIDAGIEIGTFGLIEGRSALIRYASHWDKGNRSYMELEVEGPDKEVEQIADNFSKAFAPPSDKELDKLKKEAVNALMEQHWGAAQDAIQVVLAWRPDDTEALATLGSALAISRDLDAAERVMNRLLELKPDSFEAQLNLGNVCMDRQDYDKAIEHYRRIIDLKPGDPFGPFIVATAYEAKGDTAEAIELYTQAAGMKKTPGPTDFPELAREALAKLK